jgi:hypothetical protein
MVSRNFWFVGPNYQAKDSPALILSLALIKAVWRKDTSVGLRFSRTRFGYSKLEECWETTAPLRRPRLSLPVREASNGFFLQDSWKASRNLTVTYGLRWDYAMPEHEQYGRLGQLDPTLSNTSAGGQLGTVQCTSNYNCSFYKTRLSFRAWA